MLFTNSFRGLIVKIYFLAARKYIQNVIYGISKAATDNSFSLKLFLYIKEYLFLITKSPRLVIFPALC